MRTDSRLQARFAPAQLKKVAEIQAATGLNTSQVLRHLVDAAQVEPVSLSTNSKSDGIRQDKSVAFAA
jgi:phospholipid N-methyltransferase